MGEEVPVDLVCESRSAAEDDCSDVGNLGGFLDPPSQDPSLLECCEILKE